MGEEEERETETENNNCKRIDASSLEARFYRALYEKVKELPKIGKPTLFLNLLYKALKIETELIRCNAFAKRLLEVSTSTPSLTAAILFLLAEIAKSNPLMASLATLRESRNKTQNKNK